MSFRIAIGAVCLAARALACVPLESTVVHFDEWDYQRCAARIEEAARINRKINLLYTLHYRLGAGGRIAGYCFYTAQNVCVPLEFTLASKVRSYLDDCTTAAARTGRDVAVLFQIDDGTGDSITWRNDLAFDPAALYGGFSYERLLVEPVTDALVRSLAPGHRVEMSLQGEMGATLGAFPEAWRALVKTTRSRLSRFDAQVGVSLNYGGVFGASLAPGGVDAAKVESLFAEADFLGVSGYHEVDVPVPAVGFRASLDSMAGDLLRYDVKIPVGKRRRFSEMGIGGGAADGSEKPAANVSEAALAPWAGVVGPYRSAWDPWRRQAMANFRVQYFRALLKFLEEPPADLNVTAAYLWNADSFDVQDLYPFTKGYGDPAIGRAIAQHNSACEIENKNENENENEIENEHE